MNTFKKKFLGGMAAGAAVLALSACLLPVGDGENLTIDGRPIPPVPPDTNLTFVVENVLSSKCGACHGVDPSTSDPLSLRNVTQARATLFNEDGSERLTYQLPEVQPRFRVLPNEPDSSYLLQKVITGSPKTGDRMPRNAPALSADEINIIRRWIEKGAPLE